MSFGLILGNINAFLCEMPEYFLVLNVVYQRYCYSSSAGWYLHQRKLGKLYSWQLSSIDFQWSFPFKQNWAGLQWVCWQRKPPCKSAPLSHTLMISSLTAHIVWECGLSPSYSLTLNTVPLMGWDSFPFKGRLVGALPPCLPSLTTCTASPCEDDGEVWKPPSVIASSHCYVMRSQMRRRRI